MITIDELKDMAYLPGEIAYLEREINALKHWPYLRDMASHQRAECAAALTELIGTLQERWHMSILQLKKLQDFMDSINDSFTRDLFRLRYECAREWPQVSRIITESGFYYEECSLRQICGRYLEKYNRNDKEKN